MNQAEFVRLVKHMRSLQREFFRLRPDDRPPSLIHEAKEAEKTVDQAIRDLQQGQQRLFGDDG